MNVLRATAYVLTSLASLLFIAIVIWAGVKAVQLQQAFSDLGGSPFGTSTPVEGASSGETQWEWLCSQDPSTPGC
ncbi:hypothetical protein ACFQE5_01660 [Pseudonocardia hispaniensis]|uniref:Uncharacterized protein n=1 Tax=Pseudonocardia hispaniensis TaxID=904933 RepID=A0ABW1IWQ2_9PSEU